MELIRAHPRRHIHYGCPLAELGGERVALDLEFLNGVDRKLYVQAFEMQIVVEDAVDRELVELSRPPEMLTLGLLKDAVSEVA